MTCNRMEAESKLNEIPPISSSDLVFEGNAIEIKTEVQALVNRDLFAVHSQENDHVLLTKRKTEIERNSPSRPLRNINKTTLFVDSLPSVQTLASRATVKVSLEPVQCLLNEDSINVICERCSTRFNSLYQFLNHLHGKNKDIQQQERGQENPEKKRRGLNSPTKSHKNSASPHKRRRLFPITTTETNAPVQLQPQSDPDFSESDNYQDGGFEDDYFDGDGDDKLFPDNSNKVKKLSSSPVRQQKESISKNRNNSPYNSPSRNSKAIKTTKLQKSPSKKDSQDGQDEAADLFVTNEKRPNAKSSPNAYLKGITTPVMCEICGAIWPNNTRLRWHMYSHSDKRHFVCEFPDCKKEFKFPNHLTRHLLTHNDEKMALCEECGKCFHTKSALNVHMSVHRGKTFKCGECDFTTNFKNSLSAHVKARHRDQTSKLFTCVMCSKEFKHRSSWINHERNHTGEKRLKCGEPGCDFATVWHKTLQNHKRVVHLGLPPISHESLAKVRNRRRRPGPSAVRDIPSIYGPPAPRPPQTVKSHLQYKHQEQVTNALEPNQGQNQDHQGQETCDQEVDSH